MSCLHGAGPPSSARPAPLECLLSMSRPTASRDMTVYTVTLKARVPLLTAKVVPFCKVQVELIVKTSKRDVTHFGSVVNGRDHPWKPEAEEHVDTVAARDVANGVVGVLLRHGRRLGGKGVW